MLKSSTAAFNDPYIFFSFFIPFWLAISLLLALIGRWRSLARYYPYQHETIDKKKIFQSANIAGVSYKSCLIVGGNTQGLYISVFFIFSFGSRPLFIPWHDITIKKVKYWWLPMIELTVKQAPDVKIRFFQSMLPFLEEVCGRPLVTQDRIT
jgi:hypothetical protein